MKIVSVEEMRCIERAADASGWSYDTMMEHAGQVVAMAMQERISDLHEHLTLVLVGPGNNGGDGLVAARHLHDEGCPVAVYCWKRHTEGDENYRLVQERSIRTVHAAADPDLSELRRLLHQADVIVDAFLGTGATRPIEGQLKDILDIAKQELRERRETKEMSEHGLVSPAFPSFPSFPSFPFVIAVDCPSGLNCDTGAIDPAALPADLTVTFANPKRGHFLFPGAAGCGELLVADIGADPALTADVQLELATPPMIARLLPARPPHAHKGTFGKALLVVGSVNYTGAAYLAGAAASRVGAGLVTLAVAESLHPILAAALHEPTWLLLPEDTGVIAPDAVRLVREKAADYQALLLGCGLTQEKPAVEFVQQLLHAGQAARLRLGFVPSDETAGKPTPALPPLIIDADGLNILAQTDGWPQVVPPNSVLTPHPGEMARLCGCQTSEVNADRWGLTQTRAAAWGQVVLLKGAYTVVAAPDGRTVVLPFANPGLASGGAGDVLAGTIAGLLAQGLAPFDAAVVGGYLHGLAGEMARQELGSAGMVASDLLPRLPLAIQAITRLRALSFEVWSLKFEV
ncbi:MAG: NAD(P)H-hydrate dehydratase [Chloroflexi bacterium]|nr:NAD(P)H-hydrate dehydratase [Chloroflexota bacterium]